MSICKTYIFKFVLSLSLALLNSLSLLNSEKNVNQNVLISPKKKKIYIYIYKIKNKKCAPKFGAFSSKGALSNGLIGLSLGLALILVRV